jgi:5-formyltetrahydrofolate cyclo-ligase
LRERARLPGCPAFAPLRLCVSRFGVRLPGCPAFAPLRLCVSGSGPGCPAFNEADLMTIPEQKAALRQELMARRDALDGREMRSAAICAAVVALPAFTAARAIHCYLAMRSEVDTRPLIRAALAAGMAVAVPVVVRGATELSHSWIADLGPETLAPGVFGTATPRQLRPARPGEWQLTIVPLLGFDRAGYRIGYGKGFYDRLLVQAGGHAVGVAFAAQELAHTPREPHDYPLDLIVTEEALIRSGR